jgi:hypothetical protein
MVGVVTASRRPVSSALTLRDESDNVVQCIVCGKDLSTMTLDSRVGHSNRCLDAKVGPGELQAVHFFLFFD